MSKIPCTVEILTRNSAKTLERCLESVKDFGEIIVLDGNSTDNTREVAQRYGCKIIRQYETVEPNVTITDYSEVRNKGLHLATHDWFMFIDSDEYLSPEAVEEIRSIAASSNPKAYAWWQPRKYVVNGKIIDCATTYPNRQIRLFHRQWAKEFIKPVHERITLKPGTPIGIIRGFEYVPMGTLEEQKSRWRRYIYIEVEMARTASRRRIFRNILKQSALLVRYKLRFLRNQFFCRGTKMPFAYEFWRHYSGFLLILKLIKLLFTR